MRIKDVQLQVVEPPELVLQWRDEVPARQMVFTVVRLLTDEGVEGNCVTWLPDAGTEIADAIHRLLRPMVVGESLWNRELLWHRMTALSGFTVSNKAISAVDIALWDAAGKAVDLPLYQLLGAYRERIKAYASTVSYATTQEYIDLALECRKQGFPAFKLHAHGTPDADIEICRAVREAVGDGMDLMLDPVSTYAYDEALRVGRVLEELGFIWFEAPTRDEDIAGLKALTDRLDITVLAGETKARGIWEHAPYITAGAADMYRCVGDGIGGVTALRKLAALCEAHNRKLEPHSYGSTLIQAAHLHHMLASKNCDYFEMPVPIGLLDYGMRSGIPLEADGTVVAPTGPGLGYDIDWAAMDAATVRSY
jgi:L-alanine-DL-glutamate epimerase-like enolase superfamily enzyme